MTRAEAPRDLTSFVGRTRELAAVRAHLEQHRLVSVLGPGGMGKTRLARRIATSGDGVFVDLSEALDRADVVRLVHGALGERPERDLGEALGDRGPLLLVLDNFEHLVEPAADLVETWLRAAPALRVLATSRRRLELAGECTFDLPPLETGGDPAQASAAALFVARAALHGTRALAPETVAAVVERVDGIPLAIELAAAQLRLMDAETLAARLAAEADALGRGPRTAADRHRTVDAAIRGSWDALDDAHRAALSACAVFRGGFDLAAAEAVLDTADALERLALLRDRSLLHQRAEGRGRLGLYGVIRAFVQREAAAETLDGARRRHARHFAGLPPLRRLGATADRIRRRSLDEDNFAAALAAALVGAADAADGIAAALHLADVRGVLAGLRAALDPLERAAALVDAETPAPLAVELAARRARSFQLLARRAEADSARATLDRSVADAGGLDGLPPRLHALCLAVDAAEAAPERAEDLLRAAVAAVEGVGGSALGRALAALAGHLAEAERLDEARATFERAIGILADAEDAPSEAVAVGNLGVVTQECGDLDAARAYFERALGLHTALGYRRFVGITECDLAGLAWEDGRPAEAAIHFATGIEAVRRAGDRVLAALTSAAWSACLETLGEREAAAQARLGADLGETDPPGLRAALACWLTLADLAASPDDPAVRARVQAALQVPATCDETRFALRLLATAWQRVEDAPACLRVAVDGAWFEAPGHPRADLSRRDNLARIVSALAAQHRSRPQSCLSLDAIVRAGWSGDRLVGDSAANRAHVALSTLRKLGLRDVLERVDGGYRLAPTVPLVTE